MTKQSFDLALFDLGGVLIDLSGTSQMLEWLGPGISEQEFWRRWLHSPSVRAFESGRCGAGVFASGVVREFGLPVTPGSFMESFAQWVSGPAAGVVDLLDQVSGRIPVGCLSNTNPCHWPRIDEEMGLGTYFRHKFVSYEIGMLKPDAEIFEYAIGSAGCDPARILFFEDNGINVESARRCGLTAVQVRGVGEVESRLCEFGLVD